MNTAETTHSTLRYSPVAPQGSFYIEAAATQDLAPEATVCECLPSCIERHCRRQPGNVMLNGKLSYTDIFIPKDEHDLHYVLVGEAASSVEQGASTASVGTVMQFRCQH